MYNFDKVIDRVGTNCTKWDKIVETYEKKGLLPMWVADMDFEIAHEISEAVKARANHPSYGYTVPSEKYYSSIAAWYKKRNNCDVEKKQVLKATGVVPIVKSAILAFTEKSDKILVQTPGYPPIQKSTLMAERQLVKNSLYWDGEKYKIDFEDFENKIKDGVKLFILCNPHNPVGRVWTKEELEKMIDICYENNVLIFSDEIHSDIIYNGYKHNVLYNVSKKAEEIGIVCSAPSKTFNIAGLKSSFAIVRNDKLREKLSNAMETNGATGVNLFAFDASVAAYDKCGGWADAMVHYVEENADYVCEFIKCELPDVKAYKPEATYLMWLDFRKFNLSQDKLVDKLVYEAGVVLNDGVTFGEEGRGFMRINIGCPRSLLVEGLNKIKNVFNNLQ